MSGRSLVETMQKQQVKREGRTFTVDHFAYVWESASDAHKRFLLKVADFDLEPKLWGGYSKQEQQTLHAIGLYTEAFADFQKAIKRNTKLLEKRINARD